MIVSMKVFESNCDDGEEVALSFTHSFHPLSFISVSDAQATRRREAGGATAIQPQTHSSLPMLPPLPEAQPGGISES